MTQPPYDGPGQPPSGPPPQQDPWQQPAPTTPYEQPASPAPQYGQPSPYGEPPAPYGQPTPDPSWPNQPAPGQHFPIEAQPGQPTSGQPFSGPPTSGQPYPGGQPAAGQPYPGGQPVAGHPGAQFGQPGFPPPGQPGYPPYGAPQPPKKKRGLLIVSLVLAIVLVLCGGGGVGTYLLLRDTEKGEGAAEPVAAVEGFLEAVYRDKDADKAAGLVCSEARDKTAITKKVAEIQGYETKYEGPRFRWDKPKIDDQNDERAIVSVELTMTTKDEKTAEQKLEFTVVQKTGWWVCEVAQS